MKNVFLIITAVLFVRSAAFSDPPKKIEMTVTGKQISIMVFHNVKDPVKHYIKEINVSVNGRDMIVQKFILQTENGQEALYLIPSINKGDKIEIEAECNIYGKLKKEFSAEL